MRTRAQTPEPSEEPWSDDFAALGELSSKDLPSFERTRDMVLASTIEPPPTIKERIMRNIKKRPLLVAALAALALLVTAPVAYAMVEKLFLSIDTSKSEEEIEADLVGQLEASGVVDPTVKVEKDGDTTTVSIGGVDDELPADFEIDVTGEEGITTSEFRRLSIDVDALSDDEAAAFKQVLSTEDLVALAGGPAEGETVEAYQARIETFFVELGFPDTVVSVTDTEVSVVVE